MADPREPVDTSRREALKCLGFGGAGTLFVLAGGVLAPIDLALGAPQAAMGTPLFIQISDTHIGFNKAANPDVNGTLEAVIGRINALPRRPDLVIHTGDITHLSRAAEFDAAAQLLGGLRISELHTVPGEHDVTDGDGAEYFRRFGRASNNRGYYSFDHHGVHFVALNNVMHFKAGGLSALGAEQLAWLQADLAPRGASTPVVVFAHMPMWTIYEPWGWGAADADQTLALLRRFGSVTVLNGHIHQILQRVEGSVTFHTARGTAYPLPAPGVGAAPAPLTVEPRLLHSMLGFTSVSERRRSLILDDQSLA